MPSGVNKDRHPLRASRVTLQNIKDKIIKAMKETERTERSPTTCSLNGPQSFYQQYWCQKTIEQDFQSAEANVIKFVYPAKWSLKHKDRTKVH